MGQLEASRCSKLVEGSQLDKDRGGECQINPDTELPTESCVFRVRETLNTTASIMYQHFIPEISEFCDDSSHNFEAPNAQNRLCDYRSVWDVIRQSSDFIQGANPPLSTQPEAPSFTLLRARSRVVCLVMDVSGSMRQNNRIHRQRQAAQVFLERTVEEGSKVGLVAFNGSRSLLANLTEVTGPSSREQLVNRLPRDAKGGTNICKGLRGGFEVLKQDDGQVAGDEIILLTDGEHSAARKCVEHVRRSGAIVHTIALGPSADPALEQFATTTVNVDASVGNNTVFTFTWERSQPKFSVLDPFSNTYNSSHLETKAHLRTAHLRVPGVAQPGTWSFSLLNNETSPQILTVTVSSHAVHECLPPVKVTPSLVSTSVTYPEPITVTATVSQGDRAVVGAVVFAIMENNSGTVRLRLLDDGVGVDVIRNDGVYSAYFFHYTNGRYGVQVEVEGAGGSVTVKTDVTGNTIPIISSYIDINGTIHPEAPSGGQMNETTSPLGNFSRSINGGAITVSRVPTVPQNFPPGRVTDLVVSLTNTSQSNQSLALEWTAPGEDYYIGTVSGYDIRFSLLPTSLRKNFSSAATLNLLLTSLQPAGERQSVLFSTDDVPLGGGAAVLYFALRAWDKEGLMSEISNIAQVSVFIFHPTLPIPSQTPSQSPPPPARPSSPAQYLALILPLSMLLPISFIACCSILLALCCRRRHRRKKQPPVGLGYPNVMVMRNIS
ncbi:hypothetical protein AAFF_G00050630 [Aldrovandia affinis]|uniref:VWFA domain-containing protein n=1 Tax=Aldrovandia affinis TaxID=143900 RepID=A0AAD7WZ24_9TELE|nr:hypothetical protein AAFF_G00050630 [Aldrovandia affinis]